MAKSLYWATVSTRDEADYLCSVLNSPATTEFARPYMSYGKDERHFDKHIWQLPIPKYDASNKTHAKLVSLGKKAETLAAEFSVETDLHFAATRQRIREQLEQSDTGAEINEIVYEMLS